MHSNINKTVGVPIGCKEYFICGLFLVERRNNKDRPDS